MLYLHPLSLPCWAWQWTNEDYVDKTNDLTYRLESHIYEEETLEARNLRIVVTLTVNPSLPKEDEYALIYYRAEKFYDYRNVIPEVCGVGTMLAFLCFIFLLCSAGHKNGREGITPSAINEIHLDLSGNMPRRISGLICKFSKNSMSSIFENVPK